MDLHLPSSATFMPAPHLTGPTVDLVFQRDGAAHRPQELLLVVQAVGGFSGRTRARPSVVWKPGHHGNPPLHGPDELPAQGGGAAVG